MKTFRIVGLAIVAISLCLSACGGGDDPITPSPNPEVIKSEITIDSNIITNGLSFTSEKGEQSISFSTNENWTLSVASTTSGTTWCTASATNGVKGNATVKFSVIENTDYDNRSVSVTIKSGTVSKTFTISQKGVDALLITTDKYEVSPKGGYIEIEVQANIDYKMEISESAKDWIKETSNRSLSTYKHILTIDANGELEKREGEIHFKSGDKTEIVKIYQTGGPIILLSQNEYTISDKGDTISVDIKSNIEFGVQMPDVDWIVDEASSRGLSSHTLKYIVSANEEYDSRSASIVFYDTNSDLKDTLEVTQGQKDAIILSQKEIIVEQEGGVIEMKLNTNIDFEVIMPELNWISQTDSRGLVEHCMYFEIGKNENDIERNAKIIFKGKNCNLSDTLNIKQNKFVKGVRLPSGLEFREKVNNFRSYIEGKNGTMPQKIKFIANSNVSSETILAQDKYGMKAFLKANGEWVEIHTSANEFVTHEDCSKMFSYMGLTSIEFGDKFNTSYTTDMSYMLQSNMFKELNINVFKTSNVTDMSWIFHDCQTIETLNIDSLDTSKVTNMQSMFCHCYQLKELNVSNFDTSNAINISFMFQGCEKLKSLDVSNFNTENVVDMSYVFSICSSLKEIDLSNWNTSKVENMEGLFWECNTIEKLDLSNFDTNNVTNMRSMFSNCINITNLELTNFNTLKVVDMEWMFSGSKKLESINLSNFNTKNVINMSGMFENCSSLTELNLSSFKTDSVKLIGGMFRNCSSLSKLDLSNFNTENVTYMSEMFKSCSNLKTLIISGFNTAKIPDRFSLYGIFADLPNIKLIDLGNNFVINDEYSSLIVNNFGDKSGIKIICCYNTMVFLKKEIESLEFLDTTKTPIIWINALTGKEF